LENIDNLVKVYAFWFTKQEANISCFVQYFRYQKITASPTQAPSTTLHFPKSLLLDRLPQPDLHPSQLCAGTISYTTSLDYENSRLM
jgi:hypothetical protein